MKTSDSNYDKTSPTVIRIVRLLSLLISKIFWRIEYINTENIPQNLNGGLIVSANHQTYFDPFWISIPIKRDLRFLAWDHAFEWFFIGRLIELVGAFPVSIERGGTIKALKESLQILRSGKTLVIFPEGEREFIDGNLLPFKTGAVRLALETNVPILPITILGGNHIWSRDHKFPRLGKVQIIYHPIVNYSAEINAENLQKLSIDLENTIASKM